MPPPIRVAILGAGRRGLEMLRAFDSLPGCTVVGTADANFSRLLYIQEWFPHVAVTASDQDLLADPAVNLIVVTCPLSVRPALASAALEAGKHVLLDGPLAPAAGQAAALVAQAAEQGLLLAAAHDSVYHPAVPEMKTLLALGRLGDLCYLDSARLYPPDPAADNDVIWTIAAADIATALYLVEERPSGVQATGQGFTDPGRLDVAFITVHYPSGRFSHHHISAISPQRSHRFLVTGRQGSLTFGEDRSTEVLRLHAPAAAGANKAITVTEYSLNDLVFTGQESANPLVRQCTALIEAIRHGRPLPANSSLSLDVVRILAAAEQAIQDATPAPIAL